MEQSRLTVILSPHFDDAVISLGGFLAQRSSEMTVVTVFGGRPTPPQRASGWAVDAGFKSSDEEIAARIIENQRALDRCRAGAINLSYLDKPYRDWSLDYSLASTIADEIDALIRTHEERPVHLYGPAALPRVGSSPAHTDHRIVHDAFTLVSRRTPRNVRCFFYEDIPYAAWGPAGSGDFKALLESTDRVSVNARITPLTSQELSEKVNGIGEYASQVRAAKRKGEDYRGFAVQFARARGSNPWNPCEACEIVYEIDAYHDPMANPSAFGVQGRTASREPGEKPTARAVLDRFWNSDLTTSTPDPRILEPAGPIGREGSAAPSALPLVTAVMVTYRSLNSVGTALGSLKSGFDAGAIRCIVVDNASTDGTPDRVAREHPWVQLIRSPLNLGYGRGCNLGLEHVESPYVLVMNPDVIIEPRAVECLVRFMEEHPRAAMAAPSTLFGAGSYQHVGGLPTPWSIVAGTTGLPGLRSRGIPLLPDSAPFSTDWLCGAVMLIRSNVLRDVGGFDPRFFLYFEETDLCLRIRNAGHELWAVGEAKAIHAGGSSVRRVDPTLEPGENLAIHFFPSRYYYLSKHHGRLAALATEAGELVVKAIRDLLRAALGKSAKHEFRTRRRAPLFRVPPRWG